MKNSFKFSFILVAFLSMPVLPTSTPCHAVIQCYALTDLIAQDSGGYGNFGNSVDTIDAFSTIDNINIAKGEIYYEVNTTYKCNDTTSKRQNFKTKENAIKYANTINISLKYCPDAGKNINQDLQY